MAPVEQGLTVVVNHLDSTIFINDSCYDPFTGMKLPANQPFHIRPYNHMPDCKQNDILQVRPFDERFLIVNNFKYSETCFCNPIQSIFGGDSTDEIGNVYYYAERGGRFESYVYDRQTALPVTEKKYQTIGNFEDLIVANYIYKDPETNWFNEMIDVYREQENQVFKVGADSMKWDINYYGDYNHRAYHFAQVLSNYTDRISGLVKLNREIVGMKVNSKWGIYELQHILQFGAPVLVLREENIDSIIGIPGDSDGYIVKRNDQLYLKFWYGHEQHEYKFDSLVVNKYLQTMRGRSEPRFEIFIYSLTPSTHVINDLNTNLFTTTNPVQSIDVPEDYILDTNAVHVITVNKDDY